MTTFAQGEIFGRKIDNLPDGLEAFNDTQKGAFIISHSESGHHHLLGDEGVTVLEKKTDVPTGMRILYAIVKQPTRLFQDAAKPHDAHDLDAGLYEFRIVREFDPISEQARRVAD